MKRFVKQIALFLFPIICIGIAIEIIIRKIPNDYSYKRGYLDKHSNDVDVLLLGNSHIFFGLNPKYFKENTFNAAHVSQSLNYDKAIVEKYKNDWRNLKCIVVPVDYFSLYGSLEIGAENWRVKSYNLYYKIYKSNKIDDNFEIFSGSFKLKLLRIYDYFKHKSAMTCDSLGWGTTYRFHNAKDINTTGREAALRHKMGKEGEKCFVENLKNINDILSFAKDRNIKVVFITCPAYKTYRDRLDQNQLNRSVNTITQIVNVNSNSRYYNLMDNASFLDTDFYDADHLNEKGAKKMSVMVDSLINVQ